MPNLCSFECHLSFQSHLKFENIRGLSSSNPYRSDGKAVNSRILAQKIVPGQFVSSDIPYGY